MTAATSKRLTFADVDELGFTAERGFLDPGQFSTSYSPRTLGPLVELLIMIESGLLPSCIADAMTRSHGVDEFIKAMSDRREYWRSSENRRLGFVRAGRSGCCADTSLTGFLMDAQRAARNVARLPGNAPGQFVAAMKELENNIHEHSDAVETGLLAFRAARGTFEFVAADLGIGVLSSLRRCADYSALSDHGEALRTALDDGTSRFGSASTRGHGFRPIFVGLMNLRGTLRFRSGDHGLIMDGTSPVLATAQLAQKPSIKGFFASIQCSLRPAKDHES